MFNDFVVCSLVSAALYTSDQTICMVMVILGYNGNLETIDQHSSSPDRNKIVIPIDLVFSKTPHVHCKYGQTRTWT